MSNNERVPSAGAAGSTGGSSKRWLIAAIAAVCLIGGGVGLAAMASGDEDADNTGASESDEVADFQPYTGGVAPAEMPEEEPDFVDDPVEQEEFAVDDAEDDQADGEQEEKKRRIVDEMRKEEPDAFDEEKAWKEAESQVIGREPDGEEIIEDRHGEAISQREAELRMEMQAEALEQADEEHHRRLLRRDMQRNSRVLQPRRGDSAAPIQGVQLNEELQERLQEQLRQKREDD